MAEPAPIERIHEMRQDPKFDAAWDAYCATWYDFQEHVPGWQAFFTDHHQSALAAALIAMTSEES